MNAKQEAKLNMFRATQKHCADNATIIATIPAFQSSVNSLNSKILHWRKSSADLRMT